MQPSEYKIQKISPKFNSLPLGHIQTANIYHNKRPAVSATSQALLVPFSCYKRNSCRQAFFSCPSYSLQTVNDLFNNNAGSSVVEQITEENTGQPASQCAI
jgi:hypothetical protein